VGAAKNWYIAHRGDIKTWDDFVTKFSKTFGVSASLTDCWRAMEKRQQKNGESVSAYFHEKYKLCKKLNLSFSETKEQIITGLANRSIVQGLFAKFHVDSDDLLHDIMDFERLCSAGNRDRRDRERERGVQNRSENPGNPKHENEAVAIAVVSTTVGKDMFSLQRSGPLCKFVSVKTTDYVFYV
jgi:hypothetical protein